MDDASGAVADSGKEIATDQLMSSYCQTDAPPDWSIDFRPGEYERVEAWYAKGHGFGDMRFDPFVPFMQKLRPDALTRYRLYNDSGGRGYALKEPTRAIIPLALHYYVAERYPLEAFTML